MPPDRKGRDVEQFNATFAHSVERLVGWVESSFFKHRKFLRELAASTARVDGACQQPREAWLHPSSVPEHTGGRARRPVLYTAEIMRTGSRAPALLLFFFSSASFPAVGFVGFLGCGSAPVAPPAPPRCASAAPPVASASTSASAPTPAPAPAPDLGLYLPKERAGGFTSCFDPDSAALRTLEKADRHKETDTFSSAALADDVRDLQTAMQKRYAGYPELAQDTAWDVDRFFADWSATVRAAGPTVTFEDGVLKPFLRLRVEHSDNHLMPWGWGVRLTQRPELVLSEYQVRRKFEPKALAACSFGNHAPLPGTLRVSRELGPRGVDDVAVLTARGTADAIDATCGSETVRFERRPPATTPRSKEGPVYEWHPAGDAAIVIVRALDGSAEERKKLEQIAADYEAHRAKKTVIFDFRGNGGGNDGYIFAWVDKAVRGSWAAPYAEVKVTGAELPYGEWNNLVMRQIDAGTVDTPAAKAERDAALQSGLAQLKGSTVQSADMGMIQNKAVHPYAGRVFAIVDRNSASSGESGPEILHLATGAPIVGERSGGFMEFGNIRPWIMPRTGIGWWMPSKRNYYTQPHEAVGLPVDAYLSPELLGKPADELVKALQGLPRAK